jgi:hypothetical protein
MVEQASLKGLQTGIGPPLPGTLLWISVATVAVAVSELPAAAAATTRARAARRMISFMSRFSFEITYSGDFSPRT